MKILTLLMSSALPLFGTYADMNATYDMHHNKPDEHQQGLIAFGSYETQVQQSLNVGSDITFEITLNSKNIKQASDQSTFIIEDSGDYKINYGVAIQENSPHSTAIFSIHKNGTLLYGTELGVTGGPLSGLASVLTSQSVILKLNQGDAISLTMDAYSLSHVTIGTGVSSTTVAYISFDKISH